jgi:hypothetical protein
MRISLPKKIKNDKEGKSHVTNLSIDSPRIYDHEFGNQIGIVRTLLRFF